MKIRLIKERSLSSNGHNLPRADKEKGSCGDNDKKLTAIKPMSALGEKTNGIPDDSELILQIRDSPQSSFQSHAFERQLRSTKDCGQLHAKSYLVPFLLPSFALKLNLSPVKIFL